tara:strand:- start:525 stop:809 length:285 start_codon:yes stop_codon:yes gene_type:complete
MFLYDNTVKKNININKAIWAGRRGLLELDLLLEPFIRSEFNKMSEFDQNHLYEFLKLDDDELFGFFLGSKEVPQQFLAIVSGVLEFHAKEKKTY